MGKKTEELGIWAKERARKKRNLESNNWEGILQQTLGGEVAGFGFSGTCV